MPVIPYQPNNPASQVNALKSAYLMAGGHDSNLVRQMNETMGDAVAIQVGMGVGATGERFGPQTYMGVVEPTMPPADTLKVKAQHTIENIFFSYCSKIFEQLSV